MTSRRRPVPASTSTTTWTTSRRWLAPCGPPRSCSADRAASAMDNLYRDFILEHYRSPHNKGVLDPHDLHFADSNPTCGDEMSMTLRLDDGRQQVTDVAFDGRGCAISQASASILTDELRGMTLDEGRGIDPKTVLEGLGVPIGPARLKCALLSYKDLQ